MKFDKDAKVMILNSTTEHPRPELIGLIGRVEGGKTDKEGQYIVDKDGCPPDDEDEFYVELDEPVGQYKEQWFYFKSTDIQKLVSVPEFDSNQAALDWLAGED